MQDKETDQAGGARMAKMDRLAAALSHCVSDNDQGRCLGVKAVVPNTLDTFRFVTTPHHNAK